MKTTTLQAIAIAIFASITSPPSIAQPSSPVRDADLVSVAYGSFFNLGVETVDSAAVDGNGNYLVLSRQQSGPTAIARTVGRFDSLGAGPQLATLTYLLPNNAQDEKALVTPLRSLLPSAADSAFFVAYVTPGAFFGEGLNVCKRLPNGMPENTFGPSGGNGCVNFGTPSTATSVELYDLVSLLSINYPAPGGQFRVRLILGVNKNLTSGGKVAQLISLDVNTGAIDTAFGSQGVAQVCSGAGPGLADVDFFRTGSITTSSLHSVCAVGDALNISEINAATGVNVTSLFTQPNIGSITSAAQALDSAGNNYVGYSIGIGGVAARVVKIAKGQTALSAFGSGSTALIFGQSPPASLRIAGMAVTSSGKILIGGTVLGLNRATALRLTPMGKPDRRFSLPDATRTYNLPPTSQNITQAVFSNDQMMLIGDTSAEAFGAPPANRTSVLVKLVTQQDIFDDGFED